MLGKIREGAEVVYLGDTYAWPDVGVDVDTDQKFEAKWGTCWMVSSSHGYFYLPRKNDFQITEATKEEIEEIYVTDVSLLLPLAESALSALDYLVERADQAGRNENMSSLMSAKASVSDVVGTMKMALLAVAKKQDLPRSKDE